MHTISDRNHHHHQKYHSSQNWQIPQEEITTFLRKWSATYYPSRFGAHDQSRIEQWERFWGDSNGGGGIDCDLRILTKVHYLQLQQHGHGNTYWPMKNTGGYATSMISWDDDDGRDVYELLKKTSGECIAGMQEV